MAERYIPRSLASEWNEMGSVELGALYGGGGGCGDEKGVEYCG